MWPISPHLSTKKSNSYISSVIGHEGPNSLLSGLIKANLAASLTAGTSARLNRAFNEFDIAIALTAKGEQNYEQVIEMVYSFINQIRDEGPQEYIYQEKQRMGLIGFDNVTKGGGLDYARLLGKRMNHMNEINEEDVKNMLYNTFAFEEFDKEDIAMRLKLLVPENMIAIFHSKLLEKEEKAQPEKWQKERFYDKLFTIEQFS